jgi:uncharacterized protein (TIGR02996 family)
MGETEELHAALEEILLAMVEEGELELATRRGASSIAGPLLLLLESRLDELCDGTLDLGDWLLERPEVVELYLDGPAVAARFAPIFGRLQREPIGPHHHPELAAAISCDLDDVAARLVYADWLTERGDPRGDLIAVQAALLDRPDDARLRDREARLLAAHRSHLLGDLPDDDELVRARFHLGWLDEVWVGPRDTRELLAELATLESARFLRSLTVVTWQIDETFAVFAAPSLRAHLVELRLGDTGIVERVRLSWLDPSPRLARLDLRAHDVVLDGGPPLPSLRQLRCQDGHLDLTGLESPSTRFPALEELHLSVSEISRDGATLTDNPEVIAPLLDDPPPLLRRLAISRVDERAPLERRFAHSRLGARGATLDLSPTDRGHVASTRRAAATDDDDDDDDDDRYDDIAE